MFCLFASSAEAYSILYLVRRTLTLALRRVANDRRGATYARRGVYRPINNANLSRLTTLQTNVLCQQIRKNLQNKHNLDSYLLRNKDNKPYVLRYQNNQHDKDQEDEVKILKHFQFQIHKSREINRFPRDTMGNRNMPYKINTVSILTNGLRIKVQTGDVRRTHYYNNIKIILTLVTPSSNVNLTLVLMLNTVSRVVNTKDALYLLFMITPSRLNITLYVNNLNRIRTLAIRRRVPRGGSLVTVLDNLMNDIRVMSNLLRLFRHLTSSLQIIKAIRVRRVIRYNNKRPRKRVLFPNLLIRIERMNMNLAFVKGNVRIYINVVLNRRRVNRLITLVIRQPRNIINLMIVNRHTTNGGRFLTRD